MFLASAELASVAAIEGKLPSVSEYLTYASKIKETEADTFRYLNFDQIEDFVTKGNQADMGDEYTSEVQKQTEKLKSYGK